MFGIQHLLSTLRIQIVILSILESAATRSLSAAFLITGKGETRTMTKSVSDHNQQQALPVYITQGKTRKTKKKKKKDHHPLLELPDEKQRTEKRKGDSLSGRDEPSISVSQASRPSFVVIVWDDVVCVCVCVCVCGSALDRITSNENPRAGVDLPEAEATEDL